MRIQKKDKRLFVLTLFAVVPIALLGLVLFFIVSLNYNNALRTAEEHTSLILNHLYLESEAKFQTLIETIDLIDGNADLRRALENENYVYEPNLSRALYNVKHSYRYIDNVFIFSKDSDLVYTENGAYSAYDFFETVNPYQDYSVAYWRGIPFLYDESYRILLPTIMKNQEEEEKTVIPVILRKINGLELKNFLIVNVTLSDLMQGQSTQFLTKNTNIYMMNKVTGDIFNQSGSLMPSEEFPNDFTGNLYQFGSNIFEYTLGKDKVIVPTYTTSRSLSGYTYFATIPAKDISAQILPYVLFCIGIVVLFLVFACALALRHTSRIISPLKDIVGIFSKNDNAEISGDLLKDAKNLALSSQQTNKKLMRLVPYALEKYLTSILNSTEYSIDSTARETLLDIAGFPYEFFAVIIIRITPTNNLFRLYSAEEYAGIQNDFYSIIKDLFSDDFINFILPAEEGKLHIVLNLKESGDIKKADYILDNICSYLKNDMEYVNILIGKSEVHSGIAGMKKCYLEALDKVASHDVPPNYVLLNESEKEIVGLTAKEENALFSALLSFDREKIYSLLNEITEKKQDISEHSTKKLYNQILNVVIKAMHLRNIPHKSGLLDFEVVNHCLNQPPKDAFLEMTALIDYVLETGKTLSLNKINRTDIVKYIDTNYSNTELSLGFLADHFKISQSGVSTTVKSVTGTGFHEYLSGLRIEKASQLLSDTDKNVAEICSLCGFSSPKTFYRIFKNLTGMTPKEYRQMVEKPR